MSDDTEGKVLVGNYRLVRELRRGGMGVIYLAYPEGDADNLVALKMALSQDENSAARFRQEIRSTRSLDHPGIVRVLDEGAYNGRLWYAMDFAGHANLADILAQCGAAALPDLGTLIAMVDDEQEPLPVSERRGLPPTIAVNLMGRIAAIVAHAHERGVLHRDLKPANILLTPAGDPILADFGVAQDLHDALRLTADNEVVGSLTYIAPEQLAGDDLDERADVYALSAMLYECLVGSPPPRRNSGCEPLPVPRYLTAPLRAIVQRGLEPELRHRLRDARSLAADLERYQRGVQVRARPPGLGRRLAYHIGRHPFLASVLTALVIIIIGGAHITREALRQQQVPWRPVGTVIRLADQPVDQLRVESDVAATLSVHDPDALAMVTVLEGGFVRSDDGAGLVFDESLHYDGHFALGTAVPTGIGTRVTLRARAAEGASGEISVFLGARHHWNDGYTFQLGAYENSCGLLKRNERTLWIGPGVVQPGVEHEIILERIGDLIRVVVDGVERVSMRDLLPLDGPLAGLLTYSTPGVQRSPVFLSLGIDDADLPGLLPPDWLVVRMALAAMRADETASARLLAEAVGIVDDMIARIDVGDPRVPDMVLRRGALLDAEQLRWRDDHLTDLRAHQERLSHRADYHRQLMTAAGLLVERSPQVVRRFVEQARRDLAGHPYEQALLVSWIERALISRARLAAVESFMQDLDPMSPLYDFLLYRLFDSYLVDDGDIDRSRAVLDELASSERSSWWARAGQRVQAEERFLNEDFTRHDADQIAQIIRRVAGNNRLVSGQMMLIQSMLGGPSSLPGMTLLPQWRALFDHVQQILLGHDFPLFDASLHIIRVGSPDQIRRLAIWRSQREALHSGALDPLLLPVVAIADSPPPYTVDDLRLYHRPLFDADPDVVLCLDELRSLLFSAQWAVAPQSPVLAYMVRRQLRDDPSLSAAVLVLRDQGRLPERLIERGDAWVAEALTDLFVTPDRVPTAEPPFDSSFGRLLALMLAQRCHDVGALDDARARFARLAAIPDGLIEVRVARQVMRGRYR